MAVTRRLVERSTPCRIFAAGTVRDVCVLVVCSKWKPLRKMDPVVPSQEVGLGYNVYYNLEGWPYLLRQWPWIPRECKPLRKMVSLTGVSPVHF